MCPSNVRLDAQNPRVLAIDLMSNAFGYVVFENPRKLIDWGIADGRRSEPGILLKKLSRLLTLYRPQTLVLEDTVLAKSRRSARSLMLLTQFRAQATGYGITVASVAWSDVRKHFIRYGGYTKYEIARLVAASLPVLGFRLPPPRKPWRSEDTRMGIFDATAFGLTYYVNANPSTANAVNS